MLRPVLIAILVAAGLSCPAEETKAQVDKAIASSRGFLTEALTALIDGKPKAKPPAPKSDEADDNYGLGEEALLGLALVQSGTPPADPLVQKLWKRIREAPPFPKQGLSYETYTLALQLMCVDAMMHAKGIPWPPAAEADAVSSWIRKTSKRLASACDGGAWGYGCPEHPYVVLADERLGSKALQDAARSKGAYDYSNTQYAVLGLKAALLCGAKPEGNKAVWRLVLQQFLSGQQKDGAPVRLMIDEERGRSARANGWGYGGDQQGKKPTPPAKQASYTSMTAAGLTALLVARSEAGDLKPGEGKLIDAAVADGLAWFQENWKTAIRLLDDKEIDGYALYGLERLGVLGNLKSIGGHDWYDEGARLLVSAQQKDGSWKGAENPRIETAFALLFLCRGTRAAYAHHYEVGEAESSTGKDKP